ncbi:MAG: site-specific integrase [Chitinophagia bacterium]|jgi:site-specific recombinase XerD
MEKFTIRPMLWSYQKNAAQIYSIKIAVTINRKVTYILTGHRVHVNQWNDGIVINHENAALINVSIRRQIADIERDLVSRNLEGVSITKKIIKGETEVNKPFATFAREVRADEKELNRLSDFAGSSILLSDITVSFLRRYEQHERSRGMANNTINTTFKYLRRIMSQATAEKLVKENPFTSYDMPKFRQTDRVYLTQDELKHLFQSVETFTGTMRVTAYYFLLGCYSGLRHSDWGRFNYETMVEGGYLKLRAKKNKKFVVMPIGKTLGKILRVVRDMPPPMSNQKCNVMLKAIGASVGLKKELTTHVARHSFGCLCASNMIPKSVTAELMGVNTSTVEVYYHLTGENIKQQAAVLKQL